MVDSTVEGSAEDEPSVDARPVTSGRIANLFELEAKHWALAYKVQTGIADTVLASVLHHRTPASHLLSSPLRMLPW